MKWVDIGITSQTGLTQGAFLFQPLWLYPVIKLLKNRHINRMGNLIYSLSSVIVSLIYISSESIDLLGKTVNVAATGAYLYLLASIALIIGVVKYRPTLSEEETSENKSSQRKGKCRRSPPRARFLSAWRRSASPCIVRVYPHRIWRAMSKTWPFMDIQGKLSDDHLWSSGKQRNPVYKSSWLLIASAAFIICNFLKFSSLA